ncbi:MAG: TM2 domain-containing protein [Bacteroidales bacterium]|nr:TM2 domain-containing protein [Bacteroidales bacterium]
MKKFLITLAAVFAVAVSANAADYKVDDSAIDALIENATEICALDVAEFSNFEAQTSSFSTKRVQPVVALVLNFFVGGFGIHRHYMGTAPGMWALYTFTFGGIFGIVTFVDFIMLIVGTVDDDISQYIDNRSFFMWI